MGLITRQIGPDAKGSKLTFSDMDNNLYYLQGLGVSGLTYSANTLTITNPTGGTTSVNIASDTNTFVTGGTYSNGTAIFTNNTGGTFNVTGFTTGNTLQQVLVNGNISNGNNIIMSESDDIIFKYAGYNNNINTNVLTSNRVILFPDNNGTVALLSDIQTFTGGTVTGSTTFTNGLSANTFSATTLYGDGSNLTGISSDSSLYSLPVPNLKIQKTPTTIESLDTNGSYVGYNEIGSGITFDLTAVVITNDISEEQINNGVWLEMLLYRRNKKNQKNAKGFVVPPSYSWDGLISANTLQNELLSLYPTLKITSRGGGTLYYNSYLNLKEPLKVSRPNHQRVTGITQTINITNYLNGRFTYKNLIYRKENGDNEITPFKVPHPLKFQGNSVTQYGSNRFCYNGKLSPTYATFRYVMFNPNINNGKGGFITGPLSKTLKVTLERFPLIPSTPIYQFGKFYSTCTLVSNYSGFENKLRFSIESNVP